MIPSLRRQAHSFYKNNASALGEKYPGLTPRRILFDLEDLLKTRGESVAHDYFSYLETGGPIEYFTRLASFFGHSFAVDEGVFIPRFETEVLVEIALGLLRPHQRIVDVGTGSGNISCTLGLEFSGPLSITAIDICPRARAMAQHNISLLAHYKNKATSITLENRDRLGGFLSKAQLILSNPPYLKRRLDSANTHPQVLAHEPHGALFLDDGEYNSWYTHFFGQVDKSLSSPGAFLMEGHPQYLEDLATMLDRFPFRRIDIVRDLAGQKRFLKALR